MMEIGMISRTSPGRAARTQGRAVWAFPCRLTICFWAVAIVLGISFSSVAGNDSTNSIRRFKIPRPVVPGFPEPRADTANIAIGERLFLETRFAQFFHARCRDDVNAELSAGDASVEKSVTTGAPLPGPFSGYAMNCRACHLVNEFRGAGRGNRSYADYARRSPVPSREDGKTVTSRNAPAMVNATVPRPGGFFLHFDGEFSGNEDLIRGTLTGRNYGWLPEDGPVAVKHIARVIREDNGRGPLAREFGGFSYRQVLAGNDPRLGEESERYHITPPFRLDVTRATDGQVLDAVARLVSVYMDSLFFSRDESGEYDSSPYDVFMETNWIPRRPSPGMTESYYLRDVVDHISVLKNPVFVSPTNGFTWPLTGRFKTLEQEFRFGPAELTGMRIFFATPRLATNSNRQIDGGVGNCIACHPAPNFTDFKFHNTGAAQDEYDSIHGVGDFDRLEIPSLTQRQAEPERWLGATAKHPRATGIFLDVPSKHRPGRTDLGLWNIFANPDYPALQAALREMLQGEGRPVADDVLLPRTIGLFKTPSLRGLAFSDPYLHTGGKDTLEDVIEFYRSMSRLARAGRLRNGAPELSGISLRPEDVAPLAAFLRALNEDYE